MSSDNGHFACPRTVSVTKGHPGRRDSVAITHGDTLVGQGQEFRCCWIVAASEHRGSEHGRENVEGIAVVTREVTTPPPLVVASGPDSKRPSSVQTHLWFWTKMVRVRDHTSSRTLTKSFLCFGGHDGE